MFYFSFNQAHILFNKNFSSANQRHQQRLQETGRVSDGAAIAGDPLSSVQSADRPRRTVCLPAWFNDFKLL